MTRYARVTNRRPYPISSSLPGHALGPGSDAVKLAPGMSSPIYPITDRAAAYEERIGTPTTTVTRPDGTQFVVFEIEDKPNVV